MIADHPSTTAREKHVNQTVDTSLNRLVTLAVALTIIRMFVQG